MERQRRNLKHPLAGDAQWLAAGRKEADSCCFFQEHIGKDGDGIQKVLTVV
jgi:hypothetical protein